jgi:urocanate reductase
LAQRDLSADVVVVGAGAAGLAAAVAARDEGATVILVEANHDIGGHAMLSGGKIALGGGTSLQEKFGIADSPDQVYLDHTTHRFAAFRHADRELVRVWADENVPTFDFLVANGVEFEDVAPTCVYGSTVPRQVIARRYSDDFSQTINGRSGSGVVRRLEDSARTKGVTILVQHRLERIVREQPLSGRVTGIVASVDGEQVPIGAGHGVIVTTGGHTSNVEFRTRYDPRLTEEYQTAGEPWTCQDGSGELAAMAVGAAFLATGAGDNGAGVRLTKTHHIGCRWGYRNLKWNPSSPMFELAGASGLTVADEQDVIYVNQVGQRFWDETDESPDFLHAALGTNGNLGRDGKANGGGPVWAVFDAAACEREGWDPRPPNVDLHGWFFSADSLTELATRIVNPHQRSPMPAAALETTIAAYNTFVDLGRDPDFGKPAPRHKIETPPFHAAWATPILHDSLTGLRINARCQVIDTQGSVIPGLYCAGESAGGFALHGLPRVLVFGRLAGRAAARSERVEPMGAASAST